MRTATLSWPEKISALEDIRVKLVVDEDIPAVPQSKRSHPQLVARHWG